MTLALMVMAFSGSTLEGLRLISNRPTSTILIPTAAGVEYRIAVAASSAFAEGRSYKLTWERTDLPQSNDLYDYAAMLPGESFGYPQYEDR